MHDALTVERTEHGHQRLSGIGQSGAAGREAGGAERHGTTDDVDATVVPGNLVDEGRTSIMSTVLETLVNRPYQHGFFTAIATDAVPKGLREDVIRLRSEEHTSELQSLRHLVC